MRSLLKHDPNDRKVTLLLAASLGSSGHPDEAISLVKPLTDSAQPDPAAVYLLGLAYSRAGDTAQAKDTFARLFAGAGTIAETNFLLGKAYSAATDYRKAEEAFETTLKADARFSGAHRELGKAYLGQHKEADAQRELNLAIHDDPNDGDAFYYLGPCWSNRSTIGRDFRI